MLPLPQGHLTLNPALLGECAMNCRAYAKSFHNMQETRVPQGTQHQDHGVTHRVRGVVCCLGGRGGNSVFGNTVCVYLLFDTCG